MQTDIKNINPLFKLSYGLFVLTANAEGFDNGCIVNTVMQLTDNPKKIAVCVNKSNFTHDMILKSGKANISILSTDADMDIFERFGFVSGATTDKFKDFNDINRSENGLIYITKQTNSYISVCVSTTVDCQTHTLFICEVTESKALNDLPSITYQYYFDNVKPKPKKKKGFVCKICGYVYDGESLPDDFICPLCKHPASDFEPIE